MNSAKYKEAEVNAVLYGWGHGMSDEEIVELLRSKGFNRSETSVKHVRHRRGWVANVQRAEPKPLTSAARSVPPSGDITFKQAMLRAAKAGAETVVCGVVKDHRPIRPVTYRPECIVPTRSAIADL